MATNDLRFSKLIGGSQIVIAQIYRFIFCLVYFSDVRIARGGIPDLLNFKNSLLYYNLCFELFADLNENVAFY